MAIIKRRDLEFVEADESTSLTAARIKTIHSLFYANVFVAAITIGKNRIIVTEDGEFKGAYPYILWIR